MNRFLMYKEGIIKEYSMLNFKKSKKKIDQKIFFDSADLFLVVLLEIFIRPDEKIEWTFEKSLNIFLIYPWKNSCFNDWRNQEKTFSREFKKSIPGKMLVQYLEEILTLNITLQELLIKFLEYLEMSKFRKFVYEFLRNS